MISGINNTYNMNSFVTSSIKDRGNRNVLQNSSYYQSNKIPTPAQSPVKTQQTNQNTSKKVITLKEFFTQKENMALGLLSIPILAATLLLSSKPSVLKTIAPKFLDLPKNISFENGNTMPEALNFAKDTFGMKLEMGNNLKLANLVNFIITEISNTCKGKLALPKLLKKENLEKGTTASCVLKDNGVIKISDENYNIKDIPTIEQLKKYIAFIKKIPADEVEYDPVHYKYYEHLFEAIAHELGHFNHAANDIKAYTSPNINFNRLLGKDYHNINEFFIENCGTVEGGRTYAFDSPEEFVAETFALMMKGDVKIPDRIVEIYKQFKGYIPPSFKF